VKHIRQQAKKTAKPEISTGHPTLSPPTQSRSMKDRSPRKKQMFCWSREVMNGVVCYRLFRRDHTGRPHHRKCTFYDSMTRPQIADILNQERHALRDRVDEIDLKAMGVM
jgi:hypothetical protein